MEQSNSIKCFRQLESSLNMCREYVGIVHLGSLNIHDEALLFLNETAVPPPPASLLKLVGGYLPAFSLSERTIARRWRLRKVDGKCM